MLVLVRTSSGSQLFCSCAGVFIARCRQVRNAPVRNRRHRLGRKPSLPAPAPHRTIAKCWWSLAIAYRAGYGLEPGQSFPDDLQKKLDAQGYAWHVVNLGISGDTTEGGVARMDSATSLNPASCFWNWAAMTVCAACLSR